MAVYTELDPEVLSAWLSSHDVGSLVSCEGIASGIENSNFFVTTREGRTDHRFVLTLFERLATDELSFCLALMLHLATRGVPCPAPIADRHGALCSPLVGKPAALVTRLEGHSLKAPAPAHCAAIGAALATMHVAAMDLPVRQPNPRGLSWWRLTASRVARYCTPEQRALLDAELGVIDASWDATTASLPRGAIHADLFRDNALFVEAIDDERAQLGGLIDFYFAGCDAFVLDIAICANDWCIDLASGAFDGARLAALLDAYRATRALSTDECAAFGLALRAAALRFWLSRLDDLHSPRPAQLLVPHDPAHFERILRLRRDEARSGVVALDILAASPK